jgi:hypothetical protein
MIHVKNKRKNRRYVQHIRRRVGNFINDIQILERGLKYSFIHRKKNRLIKKRTDSLSINNTIFKYSKVKNTLKYLDAKMNNSTLSKLVNLEPKSMKSMYFLIKK